MMSEPLPEEIRAVHARARCLFTKEQVEAALDNMATAITADLGQRNPILLCVMTGAVVTVSELALRLDFPLQLDYVHATRYNNSTAGAELRWLRHPSLDLRGRTVLIVDDILDQGATLHNIVRHCQGQGAEAVYSAVLVHKEHERKLSDLQADYTGLYCPDHYVYGYGMDYRGYLRNVAAIYAVAKGDV